MRPYQWDPAPKYRRPTLWQGLKETAGIWLPLLMLAVADILGI